MKDLNRLVSELKNDLDSLGIKYQNVLSFSVNTRAKRRWGQCKKIGLNTFEINISSLVLDDALDDMIAKNVLVHELLHTVNGCFSHRGKWKTLANEINGKIPKYNIKTKDTFTEIKVPQTSKKPKYIVFCKKCDFKTERYKESPVTKHINRYRCPKCSGKLYTQKLF